MRKLHGWAFQHSVWNGPQQKRLRFASFFPCRIKIRWSSSLLKCLFLFCWNFPEQSVWFKREWTSWCWYGCMDISWTNWILPVRSCVSCLWVCVLYFSFWNGHKKTTTTTAMCGTYAFIRFVLFTRCSCWRFRWAYVLEFALLCFFCLFFSLLSYVCVCLFVRT